MNPSMKLSQPKSARAINTARVLSSLRLGENLSKAELARLLELNKVSVGEIVDSLLADGFVEELGKMEAVNGRKPTALKLVPSARYVLSVDIGRRNTSIALCDMTANVVKFERIPTVVDVKVEEFCVGIIKSCIRVMKLVEPQRILGVGVTVGGRISSDGGVVLECPYLPWRSIPLGDAFSQVLKLKAVVCNSTTALVAAERFASYGSGLLDCVGPIMYLDWSDGFNLAFVEDGKVFGNCNRFGHLKVSSTGLCWCGEIGCLEAVASAWALSNSMDAHLKELWDKVDDEVLAALSRALVLSSQVVGSSKVVIGGEGSTIPDSKLDSLRGMCNGLVLERSNLGDKANMVAAAESALDTWVYMTSLLEDVKGLL